MTELTTEDELSLIQGKAPPPTGAPLLVAGQSEVPSPPPTVASQLDAEDVPPLETGLPKAPAHAAFMESFWASWSRDEITGNIDANLRQRRNDLMLTIFDRLPAETQQRLRVAQGNRVSDWRSFEQKVMDEAALVVAKDPTKFGDLPLTQEQFDARIQRDRAAALEEAQAIIDLPGGGFAEVMGSLSRQFTRPANLALMPFGFGAGGVARFIASEALLSGAASALALPGQYEAATELNLPKPNPARQIATDMALGGVFAGALAGVVKGAGWAVARTWTAKEARPEGKTAVEFEADVEAAEASMTGEKTVQDEIGPTAPGYSTAPGTLPPASAGGVIDAAKWGPIRNGIFAGESGGDYNALFGYQNRKGGKFANVKLTEMTVDQAIAFADPSGPYGQWVKTQIGRVATPMGAYQIVGSTLRAMKRELGLKGDEVMTSEFQEFLGQQIYLRQGTGAWEGYKGPRDSYTPGSVDGPAPDFGPTTRSYTGQGQVAVGDDMRIDVDYEVVDYRSLIRASGDLQPRDRSRINSDAQIAAIAARLDPVQLMPSPNASTGTPIVGPDNVIESGNGRSMAIARAYERHPDRAQAYRGAIEAAGFQIPEGVEQPVLIARRRTELTVDQRRQMVIDAQDTGVAQMTPTEVARATSRNLGSSILSRLDPSQPLASDANGGFVRAALATLPGSARNAMFDPGGALNALGQRQLKEAIFARAWPDPDILTRYTEGAPAELKSLIEALETAAPSWAALKADIEAGLVTPDMDISGYILDAMRLIGAARELAQKQGMPVAKAVAELLEEVDLIEGAISPMTAALVRKMWKGGRAAPADEVASFLTRYADEARKAGQAGGMFDAPGPRDVLRTIDKDTFGDLPEDFGQARGFATPPANSTVGDMSGQGFDDGALSPEAELVHTEIKSSLRDAGALPTIAEPATDPIAAARAEMAGSEDMEIDLPGVGRVKLSKFLDDLDEAERADFQITFCTTNDGRAD